MKLSSSRRQLIQTGIASVAARANIDRKKAMRTGSSFAVGLSAEKVWRSSPQNATRFV
jgi:hypothetical protein